jgi:hypothetical protein
MEVDPSSVVTPPVEPRERSVEREEEDVQEAPRKNEAELPNDAGRSLDVFA